MTAKRRYRLLCPIGRALDAVGDRWALLIMRDLHAGPARFQELETGLGIATNLLSTRLAELTAAGLIEKQANLRRGVYQLTDLGRRSDLLLWELARFGSQLDRDPDPQKPGNLRTMVLPLRIVLGAVRDRPNLVARLLIDGDSFTIVSTASGVEVEYGESSIEPELVVRTEYERFLDVVEGQISFDEFSNRHLEVSHGASHLKAFTALMNSALTRPE